MGLPAVFVLALLSATPRVGEDIVTPKEQAVPAGERFLLECQWMDVYIDGNLKTKAIICIPNPSLN